mgnify:CR=1 FL=1
MSKGLSLISVTVFSAWTAAALAQWPTYPTPGIPRLADGKPNLSAPAAQNSDGKPDLTGSGRKIRRTSSTTSTTLRRISAPAMSSLTPWAAALAAQREWTEPHRRSVGLLPGAPGVPRINVSSGFKLASDADRSRALYDLDTGPVFRQSASRTARQLPERAEPTWLGYSIGRWDGDALVVSHPGFRDGGWIDTRIGRPHSDALRVTGTDPTSGCRAHGNGDHHRRSGRPTRSRGRCESRSDSSPTGAA